MGRLSDFELDRIGHSIGYVNPRVSTLERMNKTEGSQPISGDALKRGQAEKSMEKSKGKIVSSQLSLFDDNQPEGLPSINRSSETC